MLGQLPSGNFLGFYRQCQNPATDTQSVPEESISITFVRVARPASAVEDSCVPNGHTGPFWVGVHGSAEYDNIDHHAINIGRPAGGAEAALDGSEFLDCRSCGRVFSIP